MTRRVKHKKKNLYMYCVCVCVLFERLCMFHTWQNITTYSVFVYFFLLCQINLQFFSLSHLEPHFNLHSCWIIYVTYLFVMLFLFLCNQYLTLTVRYWYHWDFKRLGDETFASPVLESYYVTRSSARVSLTLFGYQTLFISYTFGCTSLSPPRLSKLHWLGNFGNLGTIKNDE